MSAPNGPDEEMPRRRRLLSGPPVSVGQFHDGTRFTIPRYHRGSRDRSSSRSRKSLDGFYRTPVPLRLTEVEDNPTSPPLPEAPPTTPATPFWHNAPLPPSPPRANLALKIPLPATPSRPWTSPTLTKSSSNFPEDPLPQPPPTPWQSLVSALSFLGYWSQEMASNLPYHIAHAVTMLFALMLRVLGVPRRKINGLFRQLNPAKIHTLLIIAICAPIAVLVTVLVGADVYMLASDPTFFRFYFAPEWYAPYGAAAWAASHDAANYAPATAEWKSWWDDYRASADFLSYKPGFVRSNTIYDTLWAPPSLSNAELRKRFHDEARRWHPDKGRPGGKDGKVMVHIYKAWGKLGSARERCTYDSTQALPVRDECRPRPINIYRRHHRTKTTSTMPSDRRHRKTKTASTMSPKSTSTRPPTTYKRPMADEQPRESEEKLGQSGGDTGSLLPDRGRIAASVHDAWRAVVHIAKAVSPSFFGSRPGRAVQKLWGSYFGL